MLIIPAIDLKDGKCVRLKQGRMEDDTVFSDDPVATAQHWVDEGARRLHLVDLNGNNDLMLKGLTDYIYNIPGKTDISDLIPTTHFV